MHAVLHFRRSASKAEVWFTFDRVLFWLSGGLKKRSGTKD